MSKSGAKMSKAVVGKVMKAYLKEFWTDKRSLFIVSMLIIYSFVFVFTAQQQGAWIAFGSGMVAFIIIEYAAHRFILHGVLAKWMTKAYKGHEDHHDHPTDMVYLLTPNAYNVPNHILLWVVACIITGSLHLGSAALIGLSLYHLYYEWSHFISHRAIVPLTPWGKWMKKYHLLHHFKSPNHRYGVTNPAIDIIVGTYASLPGKTRKKDV